MRQGRVTGDYGVPEMHAQLLLEHMCCLHIAAWCCAAPYLSRHSGGGADLDGFLHVGAFEQLV